MDVDRALARSREIVIADADRTNATLSAYFQGVVTPPSADDAEMRDWFAAFVERQIAEHFNALIDLGAGDLILKQLAREVGLTAFLERYSIRPVAVHLLGPDPDDLAYLHDVERDGLFAPAATILVLNAALVPLAAVTRSLPDAIRELLARRPSPASPAATGSRAALPPPNDAAASGEADMAELVERMRAAARQAGIDDDGPLTPLLEAFVLTLTRLGTLTPHRPQCADQCRSRHGPCCRARPGAARGRCRDRTVPRRPRRRQGRDHPRCRPPHRPQRRCRPHPSRPRGRPQFCTDRRGRKAFNKDTGPLADMSHPEAERVALAHLFAGAIGSYKNPHSHRTVNLTDLLGSVGANCACLALVAHHRDAPEALSCLG